MSAPDTPPNLEPELPEMATLREWSRHERPLGTLRESVKTRVWQTLNHTTVKHSLQPRGSSWTRTLLAAAVVAAVPGAFAATETGRHWAQQGLSMLPWVSDTATPRKPEAQTRDTPKQRSPHARVPPPSAASAEPDSPTLPEVPAAEVPAAEVPAAAVTGVESAGVEGSAPTTPRGVALRAAPKVDGPASPLTIKRVHGGDHSLLTDQVISRQLQAERQMLEAARLALSRGDNTSARIWCTRHRKQFDKPVLSQEREVIESLVAASEKPTSASKKY